MWVHLQFENFSRVKQLDLCNPKYFNNLAPLEFLVSIKSSVSLHMSTNFWGVVHVATSTKENKKHRVTVESNKGNTKKAWRYHRRVCFIRPSMLLASIPPTKNKWKKIREEEVVLISSWGTSWPRDVFLLPLHIIPVRSQKKKHIEEKTCLFTWMYSYICAHIESPDYMSVCRAPAI